MAHLTEADVHGAAFALVAEGQSPGIEAVARRLARGSRTTIHKHLQTFWLQLAERVAAPAEEPVPPEIADLASALWSRAQAAAQSAADQRVRTLEDRAAAKELRAGEAIAEARRVADSASAEIARAHEARELAEQRADSARLQAGESAHALAESEHARQAAQAAATNAHERLQALERHLADVEVSHANAIAELKAAHGEEIARLHAAHDRELDRVRVALDAERTRASALAKDVGQKESRLQDELASARSAQLAAATSEARSRAERDAAADQLRDAESARAKLFDQVQELQRAMDRLSQQAADNAAALAARAEWISPAQLASAVEAALAARQAPRATEAEGTAGKVRGGKRNA